MSTSTVLLHGFSHTGASWQPVLAQLGNRVEALCPDIRGHGSAGERRPIGFAECVADVAAAAPRRFVLAGYSMGGRLALQVALAHPERVRALVLIGASPGIADDAEREARRDEDEALAAELDEGLTVDAFARRWARQPLLRHQPGEVAAVAHEDRLRNTPGGLAAVLRGLGAGTMAPLWARLGELGVPTTLIAGERDAKYLVLAERMAALMPRARALIVPGAGHAVHLEAPAVVAAALLEEQPAAGASPAPGWC